MIENKINEKIMDDVIDELQGIKCELSQIKKKDAKQVLHMIIAVIISLCIGLGSGALCYHYWDDIQMFLFPKSSASEVHTVLESKFVKIAKLNTGMRVYEAYYDTGKNYHQIFGKDIPFTGKSFSFSYKGCVEAGISDLTKADISVNSKTNQIIVKLPDIEINNITIDAKSFGNIEQSNNVFNQIKIEDFNEAYSVLQDQLVESAKEQGLIDDSRQSAEEILRSLLSDVVEGYELVFEWYQ